MTNSVRERLRTARPWFFSTFAGLAIILASTPVVSHAATINRCGIDVVPIIQPHYGWRGLGNCTGRNFTPKGGVTVYVYSPSGAPVSWGYTLASSQGALDPWYPYAGFCSDAGTDLYGQYTVQAYDQSRGFFSNRLTMRNLFCGPI